MHVALLGDSIFDNAADTGRAPDVVTHLRSLLTEDDVILRIAVERLRDVIELRLVCNEACDYANPIEPSGPGGLKIARAIVRAVSARHDDEPVSRVWV